MNRFYYWWHVKVKKRESLVVCFENPYVLTSKGIVKGMEIWDYIHTLDVVASHINTYYTCRFFYYNTEEEIE